MWKKGVPGAEVNEIQPCMALKAVLTWGLIWKAVEECLPSMHKAPHVSFGKSSQPCDFNGAGLHPLCTHLELRDSGGAVGGLWLQVRKCFCFFKERMGAGAD